MRNEDVLHEDLREMLRRRALTIVQSLNPTEYRELTFFWGCAVQFWRDSQKGETR